MTHEQLQEAQALQKQIQQHTERLKELQIIIEDKCNLDWGQRTIGAIIWALPAPKKKIILEILVSWFSSFVRQATEKFSEL